MKRTLETSSTPQQRLFFVGQWNQSGKPVQGTCLDEEDYLLEYEGNGGDLSPIRVIYGTTSDLNERTPVVTFHNTCADTAQLTSYEEGLRLLQRTKRAEFEEPFKKKLRQISYREADWNDKGSLRPNPTALSKTYLILENFLYAIIESGRLWRSPFITSDEDGHIIIEWKNGLHELQFEISEDAEEYLKIWGVNIEHEMHLGFLQPSQYVELWDWLYQ